MQESKENPKTLEELHEISKESTPVFGVANAGKVD
jgi:hypothetical protein